MDLNVSFKHEAERMAARKASGWLAAAARGC
jgi:hypothetical protein